MISLGEDQMTGAYRETNKDPDVVDLMKRVETLEKAKTPNKVSWFQQISKEKQAYFLTTVTVGVILCLLTLIICSTILLYNFL
jgi:hypothetical protein